MSNSRIGIRRCGIKLLVSLWINRSSPLRYIFGEYPVHHEKLNIHQPISFNSGSRTSVFNMAGVTIDGPYEVYSRSCLTTSV